MENLSDKTLEILGPILIVLTTRSYALTSDATGVATGKCHLAVLSVQTAFATPVVSEVKA